MTNLTCRAGCRTDRLTFPPVFRARHNDGRNAKFPLPAAIARKWRLRMIVVTGMAGGAEVPDGTCATSSARLRRSTASATPATTSAQQAATYYQQSLALFEELGDSYLKALVLDHPRRQLPRSRRAGRRPQRLAGCLGYPRPARPLHSRPEPRLPRRQPDPRQTPPDRQTRPDEAQGRAGRQEAIGKLRNLREEQNDSSAASQLRVPWSEPDRLAGRHRQTQEPTDCCILRLPVASGSPGRLQPAHRGRQAQRPAPSSRRPVTVGRPPPGASRSPPIQADHPSTPTSPLPPSDLLGKPPG